MHPLHLIFVCMHQTDDFSNRFTLEQVHSPLDNIFFFNTVYSFQQHRICENEKKVFAHVFHLYYFTLFHCIYYIFHFIFVSPFFVVCLHRFDWKNFFGIPQKHWSKISVIPKEKWTCFCDMRYAIFFVYILTGGLMVLKEGSKG